MPKHTIGELLRGGALRPRARPSQAEAPDQQNRVKSERITSPQVALCVLNEGSLCVRFLPSWHTGGARGHPRHLGLSVSSPLTAPGVGQQSSEGTRGRSEGRGASPFLFITVPDVSLSE